MRIYNVQPNLAVWAAGNFSVGQRCSDAGGANAYQCITGGNSTAAPSGQGSSINNGGGAVFKWLSLIDFTSLPACISNLYYTLGAGGTNSGLLQSITIYNWNNGTLTSSVGAPNWLSYGPINSNGFSTTITVAAGEGWNATTSDAMYFNAAKGCSFQMAATGTGSLGWYIGVNNTYIDSWQFFDGNPASTSGVNGNIIVSCGTAGVTIKNCIFDATGHMVYFPGTLSFVENCFFRGRQAVQVSGTPTWPVKWDVSANGAAVNCTAIGSNASTASGPVSIFTNLNGNVGSVFAINCAAFGFPDPFYSQNVNGAIAVSYCCTDVSSLSGSGSTDAGHNLFGQSIGSQFVNASSNAQLVVTSNCINAGQSEPSYISTSTDAYGTPRPQETAWDIGANEYIPVSTSAPAPAAAVGYTVQTYGPTMSFAANPTVSLGGANWAPFTFFGVPWQDIVVEQLPNGNLMLNTGNMGDSYGGQLCTAVYDAAQPDYMRGTAFGGGAFFEATISFSGTPNITGVSFWANDIESMAAASAGDLTRRQWPGQAAGYGDWIELDFPEFDTGTTNSYGFGIHNWYGTPTSTLDVNTGSYPGFISPITVPPGTDFSLPHKYGFLWVPASGTIPPPTNIFGNTALSGAVVGNPGTLWTGGDATSQANGLAFEVIASSANSVSLRMYGTPSSNGDCNIYLSGLNGTATSASTTYQLSLALGVGNGSTTNIGSIAITSNNLNSGEGYIGGAVYEGVSVTSSVVAFTTSFQTAVGTAFNTFGIDLAGLTMGSPVDITLIINSPEVLQAGTSGGGQGYAKWFFDDVQVGNAVYWNMYNAANNPPPVQGTSAYSVMDTRHFALIMGLGSTTNPMTIYAASVWQETAANNIVAPAPPPPPPPTPPPPPPPNPPAPGTSAVLTINPFTQSVVVNTTVSVSGTWQDVPQVIISEDGNQISALTLSLVSGVWTDTFMAPLTAGTYSVSAGVTLFPASATTSLTVVVAPPQPPTPPTPPTPPPPTPPPPTPPPPAPPPPPIAGPMLTINPFTQSVTVNTTVSISGTWSDVPQVLISEDGTVMDALTLQAVSGVWMDTFTAPLVAGSYTVSASATLFGVTASTMLTVTPAIAPPAPPSPTPPAPPGPAGPSPPVLPPAPPGPPTPPTPPSPTPPPPTPPTPPVFPPEPPTPPVVPPSFPQPIYPQPPVAVQPGYQFPQYEKTPGYVDTALGPMDRLRSWSGWTAEGQDPILQQPENTLRMDDGQLLYGDDPQGPGGPGGTQYGNDDEPVITHLLYPQPGAGIGEFIIGVSAIGGED